LRHPRLPLYTTTGHVNDSPTINTLDDVRIHSFLTSVAMG
jgi:hypothetical protein